MNYNKLLQKQIDKYLSVDMLKDENMLAFLKNVHDSYAYYERDKMLSERAFRISEEEYQEVNTQLKNEFENKIKSIRNLRQGLGLADSENLQSDDLLVITELMNKTLAEREAALAGIRKSEERNQLIMNAALDAIIMIDTKGNITFWNHQAEHIFDYKQTEVLHQKLYKFIIPNKYQASHIHGMKQFYNSKKGPVLQKQFETTAVRRNGEEFPIELYIIPIEQNEGLQYCGFIRDISARKKTEEELIQTSQVAKLNKNGVIITDYNGRITWSNDQFVKMIGYKMEEVLGQTPVQLLKGPVSSGPQIEILSHAYLQEKDFEIELQAYQKNKTTRWLKCNGQLVKGEEFNKNNYFIILEDITEKKISQEQIRLQEEKYRNIITNMNLGLLEVNLNDQILFANQSFLDMSGYGLDELIGQQAQKLFVDNNHLETISSKSKLRENGKSDAYELKVYNKNKEEKWWLISGAPTLNNNGELIGTIGIHLDITDQKQTNKTLQTSLQKLEHANKGLKEFAHVVSHDLKSPLRSISGLVQILQEDYHDRFDEEGKQIVEDVISRTEHMDELIDGILSYSSIQHSDEAYTVINTENILKKILNYLDTPVHISINILGTYPKLKMNPTHFQQLMQNLLTNAIKYNDKKQGKIAITFTEDKHFCKIVISDNGRGIDNRNKEKIFDIFQKFDTDGKSSSGIGLAIVKKIVVLYNGALSLQTEIGVGATFSITIPKL